MKRTVYRAHRGVSLIEVLVAMVILLIGIYSLVRLFPSGFTTILYGRNVSQATALTNGMLQQARVRVNELPEGILAFDPESRTVVPNLPIDQELTAYVRNQGQAPEARFSDLNKVRRVLGEATKVPAPTSSPYMPGQPVSLYILNFSPIYSVVPTRSGLGGIFVYAGTPLRRVVFEGPPSDAELAALDSESYGIDYGNTRLYFRAFPYERRFKIDCSFTVDAGNGFVRERMRPDNIIVVRENVQEVDLRQARPGQQSDSPYLPIPAGARLEQDEETVYRGFDLLGRTEPFSPTDPYQFRVLNSVVGVLGFNPLAATIRTASGKGIVAKIDYDVDDWHIIRDDRTVPFSPPHTVKLTLNDVLRIGSVDEYQEQYVSLMKGYDDRPVQATGTQFIDVLVMDLETGLTLDSRTLYNPELEQEAVEGMDEGTASSFSDVNGRINYDNGSIRFASTVQWMLPNATNPSQGTLGQPEPIGGKRIRIYYRTQQNWGVQLTKAFTNYVREPNVADLGYREFGVGNGGYLYFPIHDHNHAVMVDYTWVHRVDGQNVLRTETGEYHQISDPAAAESPQNQLGSTVPYWWLQVDAAQFEMGPDGQPRYRRPGFVPDSVRVLRVRGVTVRARAIWRESERWRKLDLDSYISRDRAS
jgi:prepilin-type N-terminal cleavage/methylation domain-containing protein